MSADQKISVSLADIEEDILSEHYFTAERVPHLRGAEPELRPFKELRPMCSPPAWG